MGSTDYLNQLPVVANHNGSEGRGESLGAPHSTLKGGAMGDTITVIGNNGEGASGVGHGVVVWLTSEFYSIGWGLASIGNGEGSCLRQIL
jgi:hypothetical protein